MKTAFFPARTLAQLPADNTEALAALCAEFERFDGHARELPEQHDDYVEALGILRAFTTAREARLNGFPDVGSQRRQNIANIKAYFGQVREAARTELASRHAKRYFESKTEEYLSLFAKLSPYEFSEGAFQRIQSLAAELRELLRENRLIPEDQKRRLQRKLEAMCGELRPRTNDIDRFWGFLGEAAVVTRKLGQDLAPISSRVMELAGLVLGTIFEKEGIQGLPELGPLLRAAPKA
jgi:hypothetical protein